MIVPAVEYIEMGVDSLAAHLDAQVVRDQVKEFRALGTRADVALNAGYTDLERGYLIGLETARAVVATLPAAINAGVEI